MHAIAPARLKDGVTLDDLPISALTAAAPDRGRHAGLVRGRALIFWDRVHSPGSAPPKKRDAIDTDQITPAADCISESLEILDERWKAGAFRHVMPDFRARVHRGETFLIAGDRFAIGSSREMSPAGLKGVAQEAGLQLVIVCGRDMGEIFRRNSINLGLHVVQSPEAVADARDDDEFSFDPLTRTLRNETRAAQYEPLPLSPEEEAIRQSGGIVETGRRELRQSVVTAPALDWPEPRLAARMTTTEQILWAHRVDRTLTLEDLKAGRTIRVYADLLPASDGSAPFAIHTFNSITGGHAIAPRQAAIINDHFVFTGQATDASQVAIGEAFARSHGIETPYFAYPGDGIFHFYLPEQGLVTPGQFIAGADSHSRAYGAYGAVGIGVGSTTVGFGWATGYIYLPLARQRRVVFHGSLQPWVTGKDIVLALLRRWGGTEAQGVSVELVDADGQLPMAYRNTIANMMAEAEALNGIFAPDEITLAWYRARGITALPYAALAPGAQANFDVEERVDLSMVQTMIAKPFSPGNAFPADEVAGERIAFDKALIGSCTNGSYEDLLQAALVIRAARECGFSRVARPLTVFPGSSGVRRQIECVDPRLDGESVLRVFESAGGRVRQSWCGPCFGQGPDALGRGERAITSFNRNWQNRMGVGGEGYLASPAVVASSALLGFIAPPSALGLAWEAERFGL